MIFQTPIFGEGPAIVELRQALPDLMRRLDSEAIGELETLIDGIEVRPQSFARELAAAPALLDEQLALWSRLTRALESLHGDWQAQRETFNHFSAKYFGQLTSHGRRSVMLQYLREQADRDRDFKRDKKAMDAYLDFEVLDERHQSALGDTISQIRVCLTALRWLAHDMLARLEVLEDRLLVAVQLSRSLEPDVRLGAYLAGGDHPDTLLLHVLLTLEPILAPLLEHQPRAVPANWIRRIVMLARAAERSSWEQIAALRIASRDRESGAEILEQRFARPNKSPDDWHVRAHAGRILARRDPEAALSWFSDLGQASDGVAMAAADALGDLVDPRAVDCLERMALAHTESRAKVRGAALLSAVRLIGMGGEVATRAASLLARGLGEESEPWVIGCLHEEVDALLDDLARQDKASAVGAARVLRDVLGRRLEAEPDAAIANRVARLRLHLAERLEDDEASDEFADLVGRLAVMAPGETITLKRADWDREELGRAMARAAVEGYGLYAARWPGRWRIRRGERFRMRLWRVLHEIRNPAPNKRQGHFHAVGRVHPGRLRAHPERLGELTPTAVPGERRQVSAEGGWGPYLPLVDDVLDAQIGFGPLRLVSSVGVTELRPPKNPLRRVANFFRISWSYARLDRLRSQSIEGDDERKRSRYLGEIESTLQTEVAFERHHDDDPVPPHTRALLARTEAGRQLTAEGPRGALGTEHGFAVGVVGALNEFTQSVSSWADEGLFRIIGRGGSRIFDLAVALMLVLVIFMGRLMLARHRIDKWRSSIPLSIGGWGSRGKSGTERLKAGLFQGLGYDVFVKTTGCEAMFIHAPRGSEAREIFIYRPYDKATIWEQRDMLRLGTELDCDVFLWECMALSPRYVDLLQSQWMRDDLVTLTNAYPDHEDIQGPSGVDVARTIAGFLPDRGEALTTEREMLPILMEEAAKKKTELQAVGERGEYLLPNDLLDRFPYNEHPRNIALVGAMAEHLGLEREYAIFQMADHVVPDLGVLKKYPQVNLLGRQLSFICGNSANERAGFMNNWTRMGLDKVDPAVEINRRVITVVNNRYDRVSRSKVFADIIVRDIAADRHVLIGTNLSGLRNYLAESLDNYLEGVRLFPEDDTQADPDTVQTRLKAICKKLRLQRQGADALVDLLGVMVEACGGELDDAHAARCREMAQGFIDGARRDLDSLEKFREQVRNDPRWTSQLEAIGAAARSEAVHALQLKTEEAREESDFVRQLGHAEPEDIEPHWLEALSAAAAVEHLQACVEAVLAGKMTRAAFRKKLLSLYKERFWELVISIDDPDVSGDYIIRRCAQHTPPGTVVDIMGTQNIKGTGLDFVYRWVELNATVARLDSLEQASARALADELRWFEGRQDIPLLDALLAWRRLGRLDLNLRQSAVIDRVRAHLARVIERRWRALDAQAGSSGDDDSRWIAAVRVLENLLEPLDAVHRRWKAEKLQKLLVEKRISHARMAIEMQKLVKRQKGGWLVEKVK